jgi:hypothetical protein
MRGISRINSKTTGWLVRLYRSNNVISRFFSDGRYGGRERSYRIAQSYYRQAVRENPPISRKPFRETPLRNNTSGYNGICETFARTRKGGIIPCWNVSWYYPSNRLNSKKFYFHDAQERRQALKQALRFRKEREVEILRRLSKRKRSRAN